ncbi:MAG: peptidylprolyl isomerase [Prochlorococcaceae cyanobacterium]
MLDALLSALDDPVRAALQRHGLLLPLVEKELVADQVSEVVVEEEEAKQLLEAFLQHHQLADPARLEALIAEGQVDLEQLRWQSQLPHRIERYCEQHYAHQAETRFLQRKHHLDRVVYSLLRCKDPYLARELYLRIEEGEANFADLAAEYSQGHEKTTKGIVGPVPLNQAHPLLAERLRINPPGTLLEPFSIESWWLVVRLESFQSATFDAATRQQMARELFDEWMHEEAKRRLIAVMPPPAKAAALAAARSEA